MRPLAIALVPAVLVALTACVEADDGFPVRATLADGQVLAGEVRTEILLLEGGLGTLEIPLDDVGEVVPVEGGDLEGSGGNVSVWLRDGTELVGRWAEPELAMGVEVGGGIMGVDLPVDDLERFQMQGGEVWPSGDVYRVRTTYGDDFLVDPERTRLVVESSLGTFSPWLSECARAEPLGEPTDLWRIELHTGTVLMGELAEGEITFALPMGPEEITVPLDAFSGLELQWWAPTATKSHMWLAGDSDAPAASSPEAPAPRGSGGQWFSNESLRLEREVQYHK